MKKKKQLVLGFIFLSFLLLVSCNGRIEEVKTYTVKFNFAGETGDFPDQKVKSGEKAVCPPLVPELTGFRFVGWTLRECATEKYDFDTPVTSDITLYPIWEMYRTVTFNLNGGAGNIPEQGVKFMESAEKPVDPTRTGYEFVRWSEQEDGAGEFDFSTKVDRNIQLYAVWCRVYNVKFDLNGGAGEIWNQEVRADGKVEMPPDPSRDAFDFVSWYKDGEPFSFSEPVTSDITLTAFWNYKEYPLKSQGPGGGIVFYDAGEEKTSSYTGPDKKKVTYKWRYMEILTDNLPEAVTWGPDDENEHFPLHTGLDIGDGRMNTNLMLNAEGEYPAADACYTYCISSLYHDWFLPSKHELQKAYDVVPDLIGDKVLWTSSEFRSNDTYYALNNVFVFNKNGDKNVDPNNRIWRKESMLDNKYYVRLIRAF